MKSIGLVDYYISEWHANNYPVWIRELCEASGAEFCVKYAWAEEFVAPDGRNTDEWCREFGVEKCDTVEELCEKADYILVLAPSNPEKHLAYAQKILPYRKHTYIDKTFAPDYATAKAIFDLAEQYGTKLFSSSALRYATELDELQGSDAILVMGGGNPIEEYIIHPTEMLVKLAAAHPLAVKVEKQGVNQYLCRVTFEQGKNGVIIFGRSLPFAAGAENELGRTIWKDIKSDFFKGLLADILCFYETGEVSFDCAQTLDVIQIREAVILGKQRLGEWITLEKEINI